MIKKIIILFHNKKSNFFLNKKDLSKLKKNFSKIICFNDLVKDEFELEILDKKKLNNIYIKYNKINIDLDIKKIYKINFFLKKIKLKYKNKKIFLSPYFLSGYLHDIEIIFFELSKIYGIQFIRPEQSFFKNRFILAKNIFKHQYCLEKNHKILISDFMAFKDNYLLSMENFVDDLNIRQVNKFKFFKNLIKIIFSLIYNFRIRNKSKSYCLVIVANNNRLKLLSNVFYFKHFVQDFLKKYDQDLVFIIHPNTNILSFFLYNIRNKNIFFNNKRITILQNPNNLSQQIQNCEFIIHTTSSLSSQSLLFNKKILFISKYPIYIENNNLFKKYKKNNSNFINKKVRIKDELKNYNYLKNHLSSSVNHKGEFKLYTNKKYCNKKLKFNETLILQRLLISI